MMASSKKPVYKVETKPATDRKRRNSDLVIMWQSIWYATEFILKELWIMLIRMWELFQLWFISSERYAVQSWLEKYIPYVPEDFSESWRDGRLLAILLNNLRPGCFPDAKRLDPEYGLKNVYRVFDTLEAHFGITPNVSVEEIVTCIDGSDAKLFEILLELKNLTDKQPEKKEEEPKPEPKEKIEQPITIESCIAHGLGLTAGFVGKVANFNLHCEVMTDLDVIIEVRGPTSICGERITKRSPKKKRSCCSLDNSKLLTRSLSFNDDRDGLVTEEEDNLGKRIIPFTYEIVGNNINLSYRPIEKGRHKVTILWHGRHVSESPYFVATVDPSEISDVNKLVKLKSALKASNECAKSDAGENNSRKISVRFQDTPVNRKVQKNVSVKIVSRRVIRYIVKIYGKDIPVNAENTEALATELLKMDYDFEKCPSFHRRNSWGFAGDAERKKSVIRQFGVDVNELEAQISHRRSHSLSLNLGSKKLLQKYDSLENLSSHLNILSEDSFEDKVHEKEEDYAYITEDLPDEEKIVNEVWNRDNGSMKNELTTENKAFELPSVATKRENFIHYCEDRKIVQEKKQEFLYLSENIPYEENKINRIKHSDLDEIQYQLNTEKQTYDLPSELAEGKLVEDSEENNPSCKKDVDMISSLSTDRNVIKRIDSSTEDLKSRILPRSSSLDAIERRTGNCIEKVPLIFQNTEMKMHPKEKSNEKKDSGMPTLQIMLNSKVVRKNSKMKKQGNVKYDLSRFLKKCKTKSKSEYPSVQTFYRKASKNKKSIYQSPIRILKRKQKNSRRNMDTNKVVSIVNSNVFKIKHFIPSMQQRLENRSDAFTFNASNISKNAPNEFLINAAINEENEKPTFEKQYAKENEQQIISEVICTFKNILPCPSAEIDNKSQNLVQEPTIKKSECNQNMTTMSTMQTTLSNNSKNKSSSFDNCIQPQTDNRKPVGQFYINHNFSSQFTSTKSEVDAKNTNIGRTMPLRTHTLKAVGKFDFKQFSPPFETQSSISPVKLQIGLWESALASEKHSSVEKTNSSDSEQVNIKEKLAFWENAYKTERKVSEQSTSRNNRKNSVIRSQKSCLPFDDNSETVNNGLYDLRFKGLYSGTLFSPTQDKIEAYNSMNRDTNIVAKKLSGDKVTTEFQLSPHNIRSRSFDDFVTRGTFEEKPSAISDDTSSRESSKIEFSSASIDDNLENYDSDHTEDSGGDYLLTSTGDEYIDDEIPESASEYWGDLSIVEGWKTQRSSDADSFLQEQFLREFHQRNKFHTYPEECKVFGIAVYYGHVAVKNRFKVYTGDAGYGNLSVSMQGFRQHDVSLVSVTYMRNNIYEVTYQIMTTGYYLISIRWLDKEIPGSPFVCKVTF